MRFNDRACFSGSKFFPDEGFSLAMELSGRKGCPELEASSVRWRPSSVPLIGPLLKEGKGGAASGLLGWNKK